MISGVIMAELIDYNGDGKIDWKDYFVFGVTLIGNVILTVVNVLH